MTMEDLFYKALEVGYRREWHKLLAKYASVPERGRYQTLLHHSINSALTGWKLAKIVGLDERYFKPLFVGLFLHDYMKISEEFQRGAVQGRSAELKKIPYGKFKEEFEHILDEFSLTEEERDLARRVAYLNEAPSTVHDYVEMLHTGALPEKLLDIAIIADILNSIQNYEELTGRAAKILRKYGLSLAYHRVSVVRGVATQLVHRAIESVMKKKGYNPVIYLADGTVYIGKNGGIPNREELEEELRHTLKKFLESVGEYRLGEAAYGAINQVIVKVPEYLLLSDGAVKGFWKYVKGLKVVTQPRIDKFASALISDFTGKAERESIALNLKSIHNLWTIFNGVRQVFEQRGVSQEIWKNILMEAFGNQNFDELSELANTTETGKAVKICMDFYMSSGLKKAEHKEILEEMVKVFTRATLEMRRQIEEKGLTKKLFADAIEMLLDEVVIVSLQMGKAITIQPERLVSEYTEGKDRGVPVCVICGRKGAFDAPASLIGKGTESFLNQLPAGVRLGKGMKAKICPICKLEGSLRNLANIDPERNNIFYVFPFFTMAPEYFDIYWKALNRALSSGDRLSLVNPQFKRKFLGLNGNGIKVWEIARDPLKLHAVLGRSEEEVLKEIKEMLKREYTLEDISFEYGVEVEDWDQAAQLVLKYGFGELHTGSDYSLINFAGNYIIVSAPLLGGREAEASKTLRKLNLALLLHLFYHAAVYVPDEVLTPFASPRPLGAARAPLKADQQSLLSERGFKPLRGWIPIIKAEKLAKILTAAEIVQDMLSKRGASYGESGLLSLLTRPPGMILRRYVESLRRFSSKDVREFLKYLDFLEVWWYESSFS